MFRTRRSRFAALTTAVIAAALVTTGCLGLFKADPPQLGPDGVPRFIGKDFRHPANTPFYCFAHVTAEGKRVTSCHEIADWCASDLQRVHDEGLAILDACAPTDRVACLTFYRGDATKTQCFATADDCQYGYSLYTAPDYGARRDQLTACTPIDQSWQPPA